MVVAPDFCWSWLGLEVEPLPAELLGLLELGVELDEDAPPPAWSFCSIELDEDELEGLDGLVDGVLVAPLEDDDGLDDGEVDGVLVEDEAPVAARSLPARSQAVSRLAPSAMETAIARV